MSGLPADLRNALERRAADYAARDLKGRSENISQHYRARGTSRQVIDGDAGAVAYALSRMPGTYAAIDAVLSELGERAPGFSPGSLFDAGCGPGTAALAARLRFETLHHVTLFDHNAAFLDLAVELDRELGHEGAHPIQGDLPSVPAGRDDLVICSYALTELSAAAALQSALALWQRCSGVLVLIEPGRPQDFARLMQVRRALIAAGAKVLAPCPHEQECPLAAPDWCHFARRFDRSRTQRQLKGASLGYEDEKFSYLVLGQEDIGQAAAARVIKPTSESKFAVTLPLCTANGLEERVVGSRDKAAFKAARKRAWGDAV